MNAKTFETPTCPFCRSENVVLDGICTWNGQTQRFEYEGAYNNGFCNDCDREVRHFEWIIVSCYPMTSEHPLNAMAVG